MTDDTSDCVRGPGDDPLVGEIEGLNSPSWIAAKRRLVKGAAPNNPAKGQCPLEA